MTPNAPACWRADRGCGSDGDVEGERDPEEPPGIALDTWRDATVAAALALDLGGRTKTGRVGRRPERGRETPLEPPPLEPRRDSAPARGVGAAARRLVSARKIPGVAVDAVEPDEETTRAARDSSRSISTRNDGAN